MGASARAQGASYAPYAPEVVKNLERPRDQRSWLMPVLAVAGVVLLLLVGASAFLLLSNRASSTALSCSQPAANASEEDKVRYAVCRSNEEQIKAWHDLDTDVLKGTRTGEVLQENIDMVQRLRQSNMYASPVNEKLDIKSVSVNGNQATVHTVEVWTVTFYNRADNKVVMAQGPDTLTETYTLVKQDGNWLVSQLVIDNPPGGTPSTK